jgi:TetR/AcrR family transcriptional regulator, transcriptional repressor for nem operon
VAKTPSPDSTREALLRAAEHLVRTRGYSAFSYADLAAAVGIRKASIHHHFPAKADLGCALVNDYITRFEQVCADIDRSSQSSSNRLKAYGAVYATSIRDGLLCLCGMLATELTVLPDEVADRVRAFFSAQIKWLRSIIAEGQKRGEFNQARKVKQAADTTLSALQGAMLLAWATHEPKLVSRTTDDILLLLSA